MIGITNQLLYQLSYAGQLRKDAARAVRPVTAMDDLSTTAGAMTYKGRDGG